MKDFTVMCGIFAIDYRQRTQSLLLRYSSSRVSKFIDTYPAKGLIESLSKEFLELLKTEYQMDAMTDSRIPDLECSLDRWYSDNMRKHKELDFLHTLLYKT